MARRKEQVREIINDLVSLEIDNDEVNLGNAVEDWPYLATDEYVIDEVNEGLVKYGYELSNYADQWFLRRL